MKPAHRSVPVTAIAPRTSGHGLPTAVLHATAKAEKTATWTTLSAQKSRTPPRRDSWNFSRASSPSQPSRIEWNRKRIPPAICQERPGDAKHAAAARPSARHTIVIALGGIRGRRGGPRNLPTDEPGQQAVFLLDETAQEL